ncbi:hypothetical protein SK128_009022, partial [Halocaridina rubra]
MTTITVTFTAGIQPGARAHRQGTAVRFGDWQIPSLSRDPPAALSPDENVEDDFQQLDYELDPYLQQKLQRGEEEDIAGTYFKPKRANELLVKFQDDGLGAKPIHKKMSTSNNMLNVSMNQSMWGNNTLNLNSSFNSSSPASYNSSWGSNSSNGVGVGGSGVGLGTSNIMNNGWL